MIWGQAGYLPWPGYTAGDEGSRVNASLSLPCEISKKEGHDSLLEYLDATFALPVLPASTLWMDLHNDRPCYRARTFDLRGDALMICERLFTALR